MPTPTITIRNLEKYYDTKKVLNHINLEVLSGQVLGYIGPNGAGKSTTVKILTGLITDFSGEVIVNGINIQEDPLKVKSMIGYIPEVAELYEVLTPREYLEFVGSLYEMDAALCQERIEKFMTAFGLKEQIDNRIESFSKGMRQKVLIASGLLHNPDIIILDEPLSGLDANSVILIKNLISRLSAEGKTIFYCSHMMDVVEKVSDRIILINHGEIVADGSFEELKQKEGGGNLEQIFASLTASNISNNEATDEFIDALKN
ncbi:ABC transporter ATP-binding protein [Rhizosphaericola mali]|uniref:ABC transporter ATP-binding protein n=1 Tax=Rhizosphaericola mali TaxID=2545455 RepID=A0A5P2FVL4_9BACT|nr:ABC transporter ATP-binding protein [Rhizosphaericola mali]QES87544.1 ABC transporter ATP-binding protein [Rhizosphaericola mali]